MDIDLNCDLGEGSGCDDDLLPLITSANVSCGFHAGDPATIRRTLTRAATHDVRLGAHPGYADRAHFGRREETCDEEAIYELCLYQTGALMGLARAGDWPIRYLKPHGALYNQACRDDAVARPIVAAARRLGLPILALPGSRLAHRAGADFFAEGFADRRYRPDGALVPRSEPGAFVASAEEAVAQAERLLRERAIRSLCVHGDNPAAIAFVRALRQALLERGHTLRAFA